MGPKQKKKQEKKIRCAKVCQEQSWLAGDSIIQVGSAGTADAWEWAKEVGLDGVFVYLMRME